MTDLLTVLTSSDAIAKKEVNIPSKKILESTLEQKENYRTPFIGFNYTDYLDVALTNQTQPLFTRYEEYISIKDSQARDYRHANKNFLDLMMDYSKRTFIPLNVLQRHFTCNQVSLPEDIEERVISQIYQANTPEQVSRLVLALADKLNRYTVANIVSGMLLYLLKEKSEQSASAIRSLAQYVAFEVVEFDQAEIEGLVGQLAINGEMDHASLIISSFDKINGPATNFINSASPSIKLELFDGYTCSRSFQLASEYLESLIIVDKACPPTESIEKYLEMVSSIAGAIKSNFRSKKLVFNAYSSSVAYTMRVPGTLSAKLVKIIIPWLTKSEFPWFVNFLKLCPGYQNVMPKCAGKLLETYAKEIGRLDDSNVDKSISLTAFISQMEIPKSSFDSETKQLIATLYATFKSPIATKLWVDNLEKKADSDFINELIKLLKPNLKGSMIDQPLPGRLPSDSLRVIEQLRDEI
ncbi:hypothetical protein FOA43_000032 [Brettanomyces nanus]|uniref:ATPase expression protein 1 n=1 Tax=Eeniella nana TaxID=13502 RepID=A0A875RVA3_EENNA|nr:uncharacterized protein FOA43_000032 [Brettanomyces nanus]QPG72731.1 hypothetical protein FOA43_000032 [Brettanomyces nanus]